MISRYVSVHDNDLYEVSSKGIEELRGGGTTLSATELQILVLMNGQTTVANIAAGVGLPIEAAHTAFADLRRRDLITSAGARSLAGIDDFFSKPLAPVDTEASAAQADERLVLGASALKSSGYYVAITRRTAGTPAPRGGREHTVLVVDDDQSLSVLLQQQLELEGFSVRLAANREQIVAALRRLPVPGLALVDVLMPDADGFQLLARIRAHPILKAMPVVMMTALATRESVLKGLQLGADGYVTKPFTREVLLRVVQTVIGEEKAG